MIKIWDAASGREIRTLKEHNDAVYSIAFVPQANQRSHRIMIEEVLGAALGLHLLVGMPLFPAGLLAGAGAFAILNAIWYEVHSDQAHGKPEPFRQP